MEPLKGHWQKKNYLLTCVDGKQCYAHKKFSHTHVKVSRAHQSSTVCVHVSLHNILMVK